jgi:hypothetical protein
MRLALSIVLLVHGVAHLPGFAVAWTLMRSPELPYRTTLFAGRLDAGDAGARAGGVVWLLLAAVFAALAWMNWSSHPSFRAAAFAAVGVSSLMCLSGWPEARIGLAANGLVVVLLLLR